MEQRFLDTQVCFQTAVLRLHVQKSQKNVNTLLVHLMDVYFSLYERNGVLTSLSLYTTALVIKVLYARGLHKVMIHPHIEIPCI